jgi:hypothetical protein
MLNLIKGEKNMRKFFAILLALLMLVTTISGVNITTLADTVEINATSVQLFCIDEDFSDAISIPQNLNESFTINVAGATNVTYRIISGNSISVSNTGVITPKKHDVYNAFTGEKSYYYKPGKSVIKVIAGAKSFQVTVTLTDYVEYYVENYIDEFINENLTASMTEYEKVDAIAQFVSNNTYAAYYSSYQSLFIRGEGDCWAFASAFVKVANEAGIKAWLRNANRDPGAASGHRDAMVKLSNNSYYQVETSYGDGNYHITPRKSLFSYKRVTNGIEVYQYDGETMPKKLVIPNEINGYPVVSIAKQFAVMENTIEEIVLPDSVESIGDSAFNSCTKLKKIKLPYSLKKLGNFVFTNCPSLTSITSASSNFKVKSGVIYNKYTTTLLYAPAISQVTIPSTVKKIAQYSFYYNQNLKSVKIPSSVTTIEEGAFGDCPKLSQVKFSGTNLTQLGSFAFAYTPKIKELLLPKSIKTVGENAFVGHATDLKVYSKSSAVYNHCKENKISVTSADKISASKYSAKLSTTTYTYNGKQKTPSVTIVDKANNKLVKNTDYTVSYSKNKYVGTGTVKVTFKGDYSGSKVLTFKINPASTTIKKLSPAKKSFTATINKKSSQVTGYQIQYSTSKKFTNAKTKTIKSYKTTKLTVKSLSAKKTYYVRVRTYKKVGSKTYYSAWSSYKYTKTK